MAARRNRPSREELERAADKKLPDVLGPDLKVVFCGINPSLYSAAVGHHFARPGNRFWQALADSGFTSRLLRPEEEAELLDAGVGITNVCMRGTARADELSPEELVAGRAQLEAKIRRYRPSCLAILGITAYRTAFQRPRAAFGLQRETIGDDVPIWILPNPSGLNAHYQRADLARVFVELRSFLEASD